MPSRRDVVAGFVDRRADIGVAHGLTVDDDAVRLEVDLDLSNAGDLRHLPRDRGPAVLAAHSGNGVCQLRHDASIPPGGILASVETPTRTHGYAADKELLRKRLARIEGQVRGIARMIEDDRYCIDILTQLAAVDTALEAVALKVLEDHVQHCVAGALASGDPDEAHEKSVELLAAVQRFARTR